MAHKAGTYRVGIDLGTNSLGWCALLLGEDKQPVGVLDGGVRIFSDGREAKTGASRAVDRRNARAMRRRRDRYLRRREVLLEELVRFGLMPADAEERRALAALDPYHIRATALDQAVPPHFLGRALFHLNQRRGFKSNRNADRAPGNDAEMGVVASGHESLDAAMAATGARTYGEFLWQRHRLSPGDAEPQARRTRLRRDDGQDQYDYYPARRHLEEEFAALWAAQAPHHRALLTAEARARLEYVIFGQRDLKKPKVGRCAYTDELRIAKAHPLFQRLRLVKAVNELTVERLGEPTRTLTAEERDLILAAWRSPKATKRSLTWGQLRKAARLPGDARFKGEEQRGTGLVGDEVEAEMVKLYGSAWRDLSVNEQWRILDRLKEEESEEALLAFLTGETGLNEERAQAVAGARLPDGHGRIGHTAAAAILDRLLGEVDERGHVIAEAKAVQLCGWHHSDRRTGQEWKELPYYGAVLSHNIPPGSQDPDDPDDERYGRITNPTVHIGLGQLRRVLNALIERHGVPHDIVVELARDLKLSEEQKDKLNSDNRKNRAEAERRGRLLEEIGVANTGGNRARLKVWEELHSDPKARLCPYTGTPIGIRMVFDGSTDVDHILPVRETLDDSGANKVICMAAANRDKGARTPHEAFSGWKPKYDWEAILDRAQKLPENKRWRFAPDALSRFGEENGFLSRQLTDTQYLSRLARGYLEALYSEKGEGTQRVRVIPGRLTGMLRRNWGLNQLLPDHNYADVAKHKNRLDHRHHLIDAFVTALTDQELLRQVATAAGRADEEGRDNIFRNLPAPWEGFREELDQLLGRVTISHKPDRAGPAPAGQRAAGRDGTAGRLHNDTAYGLTGERDAKGNELVVRRVPLLSLDNDAKLAAVRDEHLRAELTRWIGDAAGKAREERLRAFARDHVVYRGVRRVRVLEGLKTIKIADAAGRPYKGYKGDANWRYDVWRLPDGSWKADVITLFEAHTPGFDPEPRRPHPAAKRVLKLFGNDLLALDHPQHGECVCRVVKFGANGQIVLARHTEAGSLKARDTDPGDPFKYWGPMAGGLKKARARQIRIDELGKVWDPGPRDAG